jgi:hypothetical protein
MDYRLILFRDTMDADIEKTAYGSPGSDDKDIPE